MCDDEKMKKTLYQNFSHPYYSARNKEISVTVGQTAFQFLMQLHLEINLKSRHDYKVLCSILSSCSVLEIVSLHFPVVMGDAIPKGTADLNSCNPKVKQLEFFMTEVLN